MKCTTISMGIFLLVLFNFSCGERLFPPPKNNDFTVQEAFTQREVPGQEKFKPVDYLKLKLTSSNPDAIATSIHFRGKTYTISSELKNIKINLATGSEEILKNELQNNQAVLFYSLNGTKKQFLIDAIESKPALYLP